MPRKFSSSERLPQRLERVLRLKVDGYSHDAIAHELSIQENTVAKYVIALRERFADEPELQDPNNSSELALVQVGRRYFEEQQWRMRVVDAFRRVPFLKHVGRIPGYLPEWALGRFHLAGFDTRRAIRQLENVVTYAEADAGPELLSIILLDLADAYAIAGQLPFAEKYAKRSEDVCLMMWRDEQSPGKAMSLARTIIMQQEIAYERGDEAKCWELHHKAIPYLTEAYDFYGWAKSLFYLSLFRFWQGRLTDAEPYARRMRDYADRIMVRPDFWWAIRDGFFLGTHWWRVHAYSMLLDTLACKGSVESDEYDRLFFDYQRMHGLLPWTRDFPPFSPRYTWLDTNNPVAVERRDKDFRQWILHMRTLQCMHIQTDLLISYGDFLQFKRKEMSLAGQLYLEAKTTAEQNGYWLLAQVARERLAGEIRFPGLAHFGA
jgi:hypothetical protein